MFSFSLDLKIEVRLRGQSTDSFSFRHDTSHSLKTSTEKTNPRVDFLTFCTLRPTSILGPFIKILGDKHIGILSGKYLTN